MATSHSALSPLQLHVLEALGGQPSFYLSGGAALGGFYLGHRRSLDLDLFTPDLDNVEQIARLLRSLVSESGWILTELQTGPGIRRFSVSRGEEQTLVDVVHEPVPQEVDLPDKPTAGGIRYDALDDLVANKLGALLGRGDVKDLVDLYFLAEHGVDVISYLPAARRKDGGMDPTTLAWVARDVPTTVDELLLLRPVSSEQLEGFRDNFVAKLLDAAWPPEIDIEQR